MALNNSGNSGVLQPATLDDLRSIQKAMLALGAARTIPSGQRIPWTATPVSKVFAVASPALGTQAEIGAYQVPKGYFALICGLVLGWSPAFASVPPIAGSITFQVDVDRPLATLEGYIEKDFTTILVPLGSFVPADLWPVEFKHKDGETIRLKGTPNSLVTVAGSFLTGALVGWQWPLKGWE